MNQLTFLIRDFGINWPVKKERFLAVCPDVQRSFQTRTAACTWLVEAFQFYQQLGEIPHDVIPPSFQLTDRFVVEAKW